jgi:hypothetical protein
LARRRISKPADGRKKWEDYEYNTLRALSLLDFDRNTMTTLIGRDKQKLFSKL